MKTIFVSIASYRDSDLRNTVNSLFDNAEFPERVHVGVFLQIDKSLDLDCFVLPRKNLTVKEIPASSARGAGFARHNCQTMMDGEDFFFQIDSHMRFAKGWDSKLIDMYSQCNNKSIISTYPLPFTLPDNLHKDGRIVISPSGFDNDGILLQASGIYSLEKDQALEQTPFISAGMLFGPASMVTDVPADPYIEFTGEEITTAIRLWTHGYNVYIPNQVIAYHNYEINTGRPRIWQDSKIHSAVYETSRDRVLYLCNVKKDVSLKHLIDIDKYGLGSERTFKSFEEYSHIDFVNRLYKGKKN